MFDWMFTAAALAYLAGALYVTGLTIINQVYLRLWLLAGTGVYICYYAVIGEAPLWEAIYVSLMIGCANVFGLTSLLASKSRFAVPKEHKDIYSAFTSLPPGDFRSLMKLSTRYVVSKERQITTEGQPGTRLYYVISGSTRVRKGCNEFTLPPGFFLGEIAFLIGQTSSASTWLEEGAEVLEWDFAVLKRKCARSARFKLALEAAISVDLARKVARAVGANAIYQPDMLPTELQMDTNPRQVSVSSSIIR